ncbi:Kinesin-like protein KLP1 [Hondaea fermentalgiana]|uniref:Kinesin-like protein n=1 Tax=Hondaea fermentalgiana TaxID=2315210 RepID=A0A2R5GCT9_9STRA|nr:Kinesin-like protein KLP1 [Hondaea fermentalgiana]|eukprot:GBG28797.1 Kinesin-like protein KLP1 [Hondaea fermentalgiana]
MARKECIKVLVRTRPTANFSQDQIQVDTSKNTIRIKRRDVEQQSDRSAMDNRRDTWRFQFDKVLHNSAQEAIYAEAADHIVDGVMEGINGTIMAYGQTGAGKTFTMTGDTHNFAQRGIIPRAVTHLFAEIENRPQHDFTVSVSFMEIYNEKIFDLLDDEGAATDKDFQITEDARTHSMQVRGLTSEVVANEEEALRVLFRGEENRIVAEHQLNKQSNRSHSIFTLHVEQKARLRAEEVIVSKLNLVDLAGSERLKKAIGEKIDEQLRKESRYINKSLTYLEQVVVALTSGSRSHIPYRQTKLTNVLKDSLGGNCNTSLIACIWGEAKHLEESTSTLKLAQRMMRVENQAAANVQSDDGMLLRRYERQIRELKQELMMHDALANRSGVSYEEYTPEECRNIALQVRRFAEASVDEEEACAIDIQSVRHAQECFRQFKLLIQHAEAQVEERLRQQFQFQARDGTPASHAGSSGDLSHSGRSGAANDGLVGEEEDERGFGLGHAPPGARPKEMDLPDGLAGGDGDGMESKHADPSSPSASHPADTGAAPSDGETDNIEVSSENELEEQEGGAGFADGSTRKASRVQQIDPSQVPANREAAFKMYTSLVAVKEHEKLQQNQRETKACIAQMQEKRQRLRALQAEQDDMQTKINAIREEQKAAEGKLASGDERIIDEEEFILMKQAKELKKEFRNVHDEHAELRRAKESLSETRDHIKIGLLKDFQSWYLNAQRLREEKMAFDDEDILDDGEQFDKLEIERVQAQEPDSVAFFKATKAQRERERRRSHKPTAQKRA